MSALDRHIEASDTGVLASDLFIYDAEKPGTGGLVVNVQPSTLLARETILVKTDHLQISFVLDHPNNTGEVILSSLLEPVSSDRKVFRLTKEFQSEEKVALTVMFADWKIVALIDGEPLVIAHQP